MSNYVTGIAAYPALARQNKMTGKFSMDITQLDPETVKTLEGEGVNVKEDENKGRWILVQSEYKPKVYDKNGTEVPDDVVGSIGSGSKVSVPIKIYTTEYKKKKFHKVSLSTVYLRKLEERKMTPVFEDDDDDFELPKGASNTAPEPELAVLDDEIPF